MCNLTRAGVALLLVLAAAPVGAAPDPATVTLTFLATCDLHGHVEGERFEVVGKDGRKALVTRGGLGLLSAYVNNLRQARPGRVVLLDAGDMLQGTMLSNLGEGQAVVRAMNVIGFDAAAVGNHEFDFGPVGPADAVGRATQGDPRGALRARVAESTHPWLTANIVAADGGPVVPGSAPWWC